MVRVLTQEESIQSRIEDSKKIESWWESITSSDKKIIYDHFYKILKERNCQHLNKRKLPFYEAEIEQCDDCGYSRITKDFPVFERDKKLKDILK